MYRVFLHSTDELPAREIWLEANDVREAEGGTFWEFMDRNNHLIRRLPKSGVKAMEITPDRRKPRAAPPIVPTYRGYNPPVTD